MDEAEELSHLKLMVNQLKDLIRSKDVELKEKDDITKGLEAKLTESEMLSEQQKILVTKLSARVGEQEEKVAIVTEESSTGISHMQDDINRLTEQVMLLTKKLQDKDAKVLMLEEHILQLKAEHEAQSADWRETGREQEELLRSLKRKMHEQAEVMSGKEKVLLLLQDESAERVRENEDLQKTISILQQNLRETVESKDLLQQALRAHEKEPETVQTQQTGNDDIVTEKDRLIAQLNTGLQQYEAAYRQAAEQNNALRAETLTLKESIQSLEESVEKWKLTCGTSEEKAKTREEELSVKLQSFEETFVALNDEIAALRKARQEQAEDTEKRMQTVLLELDSQTKVLEHQTQELRESQEENERLNAEMENATSDFRGRESERLNEVQKQLSERESQIASITSKLVDLSSEAEELRAFIQEKDVLLVQAKEENQQLILEKDSLLASSNQRLTEVEFANDEIRKLQLALEDLEARNEEVEVLYSNTKVEHEAALEELKDLKKHHSSWQEERKNLLSKLEDVEEKWMKMKIRDEEYESKSSETTAHTQHLEKKLMLMTEDKEASDNKLKEASVHMEALQDKFAHLLQDKNALDHRVEEMAIENEKERMSDLKAHQERIKTLTDDFQQQLNEYGLFKASLEEKVEDLRKQNEELIFEKEKVDERSQQYGERVSELEKELQESSVENQNLCEKLSMLSSSREEAMEDSQKKESSMLEADVEKTELYERCRNLENQLWDSLKRRMEIRNIQTEERYQDASASCTESEAADAGGVVVEEEVQHTSDSTHDQSEDADLSAASSSEEHESSVKQKCQNRQSDQDAVSLMQEDGAKSQNTVLEEEIQSLVHEYTTVRGKMEEKFAIQNTVPGGCEPFLGHITENLISLKDELEEVRKEKDALKRKIRDTEKESLKEDVEEDGSRTESQSARIIELQLALKEREETSSKTTELLDQMSEAYAKLQEELKATKEDYEKLVELEKRHEVSSSGDGTAEQQVSTESKHHDTEEQEGKNETLDRGQEPGFEDQQNLVQFMEPSGESHKGGLEYLQQQLEELANEQEQQQADHQQVTASLNAKIDRITAEKEELIEAYEKQSTEYNEILKSHDEKVLEFQQVNSAMSDQQRDITKLQKELNETTKTSDVQQKSLQDVTNKYHLLQDQHEVSTERLHAIESEKLSLEAELKEVKVNIKDLNEKNFELSIQAEKQSFAMANLQQDVDQAMEQVEAATSDHNEEMIKLKNLLRQKDGDIAALNDNMAERVQEVALIKLSLEEKAERCIHLETLLDDQSEKMKGEVETTRSDLTAMQEKENELSAEISRISNLLEKSQEEEGKMKEAAAKHEAQLEKAKKIIRGLQVHVKQGKEKLEENKQLEQRITDLEEELKAQKNHSEESTLLVSSLKEQLSTSLESADALKQETTSRKDDLEREVAHLRDELSTSFNNLDTVKQESSSREDDLKHEVDRLQEELSTSLQNLDTSVQESSSREEELHQEVARLQEDLKVAHDNLNTMKLESSSRIEELQKDVLQLQEDLSASLRNIDSMKQQFSSKEEDFEQARVELQRDFSTSLQNYEAVKQESYSKEEDLKQEVTQLKSELSASLQSQDALKEDTSSREENLQRELAQLQEELSTAFQSIDTLKQESSSKVQSMQQEISQLQEELTASHKNLDTVKRESSSKEDDLRQEVGRLQEELSSSLQSLNTLRQESSSMGDDLQQEVIRLQEDLNKSHRDLNAMKQEFSSSEEGLKQEVVRLQDELSASLQDLDALKQESSSKEERLCQEVTQLQDDLSMSHKNIDNLKQESSSREESLEKDLGQLRENFSIKNASLEESQEKITLLNNQLTAANEEYGRWKEEAEKAKERYSQMEVALSEKEQDAENARAQIYSLKESCTVLHSEKSDLERILTEKESVLQKLSTASSEADRLSEELKSFVALQETCRSLQAAVAEKEVELQEASSSLFSMRVELENIHHEKSSLASERSKLAENLSTWLLTENLEQDLEESHPEQEMQNLQSKWEERIGRLKVAEVKLGEVEENVEDLERINSLLKEENQSLILSLKEQTDSAADAKHLSEELSGRITQLESERMQENSIVLQDTDDLRSKLRDALEAKEVLSRSNEEKDALLFDLQSSLQESEVKLLNVPGPDYQEKMQKELSALRKEVEERDESVSSLQDEVVRIQDVASIHEAGLNAKMQECQSLHDQLQHAKLGASKLEEDLILILTERGQTTATEESVQLSSSEAEDGETDTEALEYTSVSLKLEEVRKLLSADDNVRRRLEESVHSLQKELTVAETKLEASNRERDNLKITLDDEKRSLSCQEETLAHMQREMEEKTSLIHELKTQLLGSQDNFKTLDHTRISLQEETEKLNISIVSLQEEKRRYEDEVASLKSEGKTESASIPVEEVHLLQKAKDDIVKEKEQLQRKLKAALVSRKELILQEKKLRDCLEHEKLKVKELEDKCASYDDVRTSEETSKANTLLEEKDKEILELQTKMKSMDQSIHEKEESVQEDVAHLQERSQELSTQIIQLEQEKKQDKSNFLQEVDELQSKLRDVEEMKDDLIKNVDEKDSLLEDMRRQLQESESRLSEDPTPGQHEQLQEELSAIRQELTNKEDFVSSLQDEVSRMQNAMSDQSNEHDKKTEECHSLQIQLQQAESAVSRLGEDLDNVLDDQNWTVADSAEIAVDSEFGKISSKVTEVRRLLLAERNGKSDLEVQISLLRKELTVVETELEKSSRECENLKVSLEEQKTSSSTLEETVVQLKDELNRNEASLEEFKTQLQESQDTCKNLDAARISLEEETDKLNSSICSLKDEKESVEAELASSKLEKEERSFSVPVEELQLLQKTNDSIAKEKDQLQRKLKAALVSRKELILQEKQLNDFLEQEKQRCKDLEAKFASSQEEVDACRQQVSTFQEEIDAAMNLRDVKEKETSDLQSKMKDMEQAIQEKTESLQELEKQRKSDCNVLQKKKALIEKLEANIQQLTESQKSHESEISTLESCNSDLNDMIASLEATKKSLEKKLEDHQGVIKDLHKQMEDMKSSVISKDAAEDLQDRLEAAEWDKENLEERVKILQDEKKEKASMFDKVLGDYEKESTMKEELATELAQYKEEVEELREEKEKLEEAADESTVNVATMDDLKEENENLQEKIKGLEKEVEDIKGDMEAVNNEMTSGTEGVDKPVLLDIIQTRRAILDETLTQLKSTQPENWNQEPGIRKLIVKLEQVAGRAGASKKAASEWEKKFEDANDSLSALTRELNSSKEESQMQMKTIQQQDEELRALKEGAESLTTQILQLQSDCDHLRSSSSVQQESYEQILQKHENEETKLQRSLQQVQDENISLRELLDEEQKNAVEAARELERRISELDENLHIAKEEVERLEHEKVSRHLEATPPASSLTVKSVSTEGEVDSGDSVKEDEEMSSYSESKVEVSTQSSLAGEVPASKTEDDVLLEEDVPLRSEQDETNNKLNLLNRELSKREILISELVSDCKRLRADLDVAKKANTTLTEQVSNFKVQTQSLACLKTQYEANENHLKSELAEKDRRIMRQQEELTYSRQEQARLRKEFGAGTPEEVQVILAAYLEDIRRLKESLTAKSDEVSRQAVQIDELQKEAEEMKILLQDKTDVEGIKDLQERCYSLEKDNNKMLQELDALKDVRESLAEKDDSIQKLVGEKEQARTDAEKSKLQAEELEEEVIKTQSELKLIKEKLEDTTSSFMSFVQNAKERQKMLDVAEKSLQSLTRDLATLEDKYSTADSPLERLQKKTPSLNIVTETLVKSPAETQTPQSENGIQSITAKSLEDKNPLVRLQRRLAAYEEALNWVDQSRQEALNQNLELRDLYEKVRHDYTRKSSQCESCENSLKQMSEKFQTTEKALESISTRMQTAQSQFQTEMDAKSRELVDSRTKLTRLEEALALERQTRSEREEDLRQYQENVNAHSKTTQAYQDHIQKLESSIAAHAQHLQAAEQKLTTQEGQIAQLLTERQQLAGRVTSLHGSLQEYQSRYAALHSEYTVVSEKEGRHGQEHSPSKPHLVVQEAVEPDHGAPGGPKTIGANVQDSPEHSNAKDSNLEVRNLMARLVELEDQLKDEIQRRTEVEELLQNAWSKPQSAISDEEGQILLSPKSITRKVERSSSCFRWLKGRSMRWTRSSKSGVCLPFRQLSLQTLLIIYFVALHLFAARCLFS